MKILKILLCFPFLIFYFLFDTLEFLIRFAIMCVTFPFIYSYSFYKELTMKVPK
jgi:hypothetical protein